MAANLFLRSDFHGLSLAFNRARAFLFRLSSRMYAAWQSLQYRPLFRFGLPHLQVNLGFPQGCLFLIIQRIGGTLLGFVERFTPYLLPIAESMVATLPQSEQGHQAQTTSVNQTPPFLPACYQPHI